MREAAVVVVGGSPRGAVPKGRGALPPRRITLQCAPIRRLLTVQ
eukprot:gene962-4597_t